MSSGVNQRILMASGPTHGALDHFGPRNWHGHIFKETPTWPCACRQKKEIKSGEIRHQFLRFDMGPRSFSKATWDFDRHVTRETPAQRS